MFPSQVFICPQDDVIEPGGFNESQICKLLDQFCALKDVKLIPNGSSFAGDIFNRTSGHRGLTGLCCVEIENLMGMRRSLSLADWKRHASFNLVNAAMARSTYKRILADLAMLQDAEVELLEKVR